MLNLKEQEMYSRQTILKEIGVCGQGKLKRTKVAIVGVGALGTNSAEFLTRAGVGELLLIDDEKVEVSNLQRQTLFSEKDIGKMKVFTAKKNLEEINKTIKITAKNFRVDEKNITLLKNADMILDCTDSLGTRFILNRFCRQNKKTMIYSACIGTSGYVMPILPEGPCLECFLRGKKGEVSCTRGILNTLPAAISALQVTLALKILIGRKIIPKLYYYDIWRPQFKIIKIQKDRLCKSCNSKLH